MTLRTDVPLMGDKEVINWSEDIMKHTNLIDIQILHDIVHKALDDYNQDMIHNRINKMCDRCEITYPEHYYRCLKCNSDALRSFKIHDNREEMKNK